MIPAAHDPGGLFQDLPEPLLTAELLPPAAAEQAAFRPAAQGLAELGLAPLFLPDLPGGRARAASLATAQVLADLGLRCAPHLGGRDRNRAAVCAAIEGAALAGLRGLKAVTGDPVPGGAGRGVYEVGSAAIVGLVSEWNRQADPGRRLTPVVGHTLAEPGDAQARLQAKLEAGARVVVTTPTLDPAVLLAALELPAVSSMSVLVGLTLIGSARVLDFLAAEVPSFRVPEAVRERIRAAPDAAAATAAGLAGCRDLVQAVRGRVAGFQLVPLFGKVESLGALRGAVLQALGGGGP